MFVTTQRDWAYSTTDEARHSRPSLDQGMGQTSSGTGAAARRMELVYGNASLADPFCYQFPLECPKCSAVSGMPYKVCTVPGAVAVDVRCKDCGHEWRCLMPQSEPLPPTVEVP